MEWVPTLAEVFTNIFPEDSCSPCTIRTFDQPKTNQLLHKGLHEVNHLEHWNELRSLYTCRTVGNVRVIITEMYAESCMKLHPHIPPRQSGTLLLDLSLHWSYDIWSAQCSFKASSVHVPRIYPVETREDSESGLVAWIAHHLMGSDELWYWYSARRWHTVVGDVRVAWHQVSISSRWTHSVASKSPLALDKTSLLTSSERSSS